MDTIMTRRVPANKPMKALCATLFWAVLLSFFPGLGPAELQGQGEPPLRIESWALGRNGMQLTFATQWGSRYRVESSADLKTWSSLLVTEPAQDFSMTLFEASPPESARFYRVAFFGWEELRAELAAARQRWNEAGWLNCQFDFRRQCSCPPNWVAWVRVTVHQGAIQQVVLTETGEVLPQERWADYLLLPDLTVERLFDWIEGQLNLNPEDIQVEFDPVQGTPLSGFVDQSRMIADEEVSFQVVGLQKL